MLKAVVMNGRIVPLEPLPPEWKEGQEIHLEPAREQDVKPDEAEIWLKEVEEAAAAIPPEADPVFLEAIRLVRDEAKIQARRELGVAG